MKRTIFKNKVQGAKASYINLRKSLIILIVGLVLTVVTSLLLRRDVEIQAKNEFALVCQEINTKIETRLHSLALLLRSGSSFFAVFDSVSREEWKLYIEHSRLDKNLPGIQGVGYSCVIQKNQLQNHIQNIRNEGFPDYTVKPAGNRELYTSIIYLEPFTGRNLRAFGFDMYSEPVRRKAMEQARDYDIAALSGKVILVQESDQDIQAGTLMYVPVYRNGMTAKSVEERRNAIVGWVYCPYRMDDLMEGILGRWDSADRIRIRLHIFDDENTSGNSLLFDSQPEDTLNRQNRSITYTLPLVFNGKKWILNFSQTEKQLFYINSTVYIVFAGGILISFLLFGLFISLAKTKSRMHISEQLSNQLKESEERLRTASESLMDVVYDWDIKDKVDWYGDIDGIMGYLPGEFPRTIKGWAATIHPEDKDRVMAALENQIKGVAPFAVEYRVESRDSEWRWWSARGTVLRDDRGEPLKMIGSVTDITERKLAEKELIEAKERAEESEQLRMAFLANMSHEVRTPLNAIIGFSELLVDSDFNEDQKNEFIQHIITNGNSLLSIISDIMDISKLESGECKIHKTQINAQQFISKVKQQFSFQAEEKKLELILTIPDDNKETIIFADADRLRQIFSNLIGNSIKFTTNGSIEIGYQPNCRMVEFYVKDTGIGIPAEYHDKIFERFRQAETSTNRKFGGSGLGLAITKNLVELMGGEIWVESESGKGSAFYFTIPINLTTINKLIEKHINII